MFSRCSFCNGSISSEANVCPHCGYSMLEPEDPDSSPCPKCGENLGDLLKSCPLCAYPIYFFDDMYDNQICPECSREVYYDIHKCPFCKSIIKTETKDPYNISNEDTHYSIFPRRNTEDINDDAPYYDEPFDYDDDFIDDDIDEPFNNLNYNSYYKKDAMPELPSDLYIGGKITNISVYGYVDISTNKLIKNDFVLTLHKNGISIDGRGLKTEIHKSQLISIMEEKSEVLVHKNNWIIKMVAILILFTILYSLVIINTILLIRIVVVIFFTVILRIIADRYLKELDFIVIKYWNKDTRERDDIYLYIEDLKVDSFIEKTKQLF